MINLSLVQVLVTNSSIPVIQANIFWWKKQSLICSGYVGAEKT